jgi:hypothetical protein
VIVEKPPETDAYEDSSEAGPENRRWYDAEREKIIEKGYYDTPDTEGLDDSCRHIRRRQDFSQIIKVKEIEREKEDRCKDN